MGMISVLHNEKNYEGEWLHDSVNILHAKEWHKFKMIMMVNFMPSVFYHSFLKGIV